LITVNDQTPPTIGCPADVTVSCTGAVPPVNTSGVFVNENCAGVVTVTHVGDVISNQVCDHQYTITRTYLATDACGQTASCAQIITVNDQTPPTITCPANITVSCASEVPAPNPGSVTTSDNCSGTIVVTHVGDVITNQTCANRFTLTRTYHAADACGNSATCAQIITVNDLTAPVIVCPADITITNTDSTAPQNTGTATASDNCGGTTSVTFSDVIIEGQCDVEFTINRTWTATDVCGNTSSCLQVVNVAGICCVPPQPVITGDAYVCPGETVTYSVEASPGFIYVWSVGGGGVIVADNGSSVDIQWPLTPGGPFQVSVVVTAGPGCTTPAFFNVFIQGLETLTCNNLVNISLGPDCIAQVLSGMILEGEAEGNDNYYVEITDQNGNIIPNATLTHEHIGQTLIVTVRNECNDQSCWGLITVEDKIPPIIECTDAVVPCGTSLEPVFGPPVTGSVVQAVTPGTAIGPNAGTITSAPIAINVPSNAQVSDVVWMCEKQSQLFIGDLKIIVNHSFSGRLIA
jgi:hypothetical protein